MRWIVLMLMLITLVFNGVCVFMSKEKYHTKIGKLFCFFTFISNSSVGVVITSMSLYYKPFLGQLVLGGIFMIIAGGEMLEWILRNK